VGVGTRDAFNAVQTDPQLATRFEPERLGRWTMSDDYLRLLASFEVAFALARPSKLVERTLAQTILDLSEGTIGEISALLTSAALAAIECAQSRSPARSWMTVDTLPRGNDGVRQHQCAFNCLSYNTTLLSVIFLFVALLYASVGQAGASGYLAAMGLFGLAPATMKTTALSLNLLVAGIGTLQFWRSGLLTWRTFYPFAVLGFPFH